MTGYPQPWQAATDLGKLPAAMAPDSVLESVQTTATGLRYNCRELIRWSRYGMSVDAYEFGRPVCCSTGRRTMPRSTWPRPAAARRSAPYDRTGSERQHLAEFRRMMPMLKTRQQNAGAARSRATDRGRAAQPRGG